MERWDDLILGGWTILQQQNKFRFGTDAVLLYDFMPCACGRTVDLCSGNGAVALMLLAGRKSDAVTAVELQAQAVELCRRSAAKNHCTDRLHALCADIRHISRLLPPGQADTVCVNPPYFKKNSGLVPEDPSLALCRHEIACTVDDVLSAASYLLCKGGRFYMVHRLSRQQEILQKMGKYDLFPIEIRTVFSMPGVASKLFLITAEKGTENAPCKYSHFTVANADGSLSKAYQAIYSKGV